MRSTLYTSVIVAGALALGGAPAAADAPPVYLTEGPRVWLLRDLNADGDYFEFTEVLLYAETPNAAWGAIADSADGLCAVNQNGSDVSRFRDLNGDGDALDAGERRVFVQAGGRMFTQIAARAGGGLWLFDATASTLLRAIDLNGDGDADGFGELLPVWTAGGAVSRIAPRPDGRLLIGLATAGSSVRLLHDRNGDGDFLDFAENLPYVENRPGCADLAVIDDRTALLLSEEPNRTIYRLFDRTGDDDCLDAAEFVVFSPPLLNAGARFALLSADPASMLLLRPAAGDLLRIADANGDDDALDYNEVQSVAVGLTLTASSALAVLRDATTPCLAGDLDADGVVTSGDARLLAEVLLGRTVPPEPCRSDVNGDGMWNGSDVQAFAAVLLATN